MDTTRYLIVGGGLTADAACKGIRERDPDGAIVVVGDEPHPPYLRPPLSKALWKGDDESTIWRGTAELGVELRLGRRDRRARPRAHARRATTQGETYALREAAARHRRPAAPAPVRRRRGRLLPHARRLPASARARRLAARASS